MATISINQHGKRQQFSPNNVENKVNDFNSRMYLSLRNFCNIYWCHVVLGMQKNCSNVDFTERAPFAIPLTPLQLSDASPPRNSNLRS